MTGGDRGWFVGFIPCKACMDSQSRGDEFLSFALSISLTLLCHLPDLGVISFRHLAFTLILTVICYQLLGARISDNALYCLRLSIP